MAKKFSNKFTHLSPVWYELKGYVRANEIFHSKSVSLGMVLLLFCSDSANSCSGSQGSKLVLEGRHNADKGWIKDIRRAGNSQVLLLLLIIGLLLNMYLCREKERSGVYC